MPLRLKSMYIIKNDSWEDNPEKYKINIVYEGENNKHDLIAGPELSEKIMAFIGPVITAATVKLARELEANLQASITEANSAQITEVSS